MPGELREEKYTDINEESGRDGKNEDVPGETMPENTLSLSLSLSHTHTHTHNFILHKCSEIFHNILQSLKSWKLIQTWKGK